MTLILVYTLSKTILGHSFFNYILVGDIIVIVSYSVHDFVDVSLEMNN